MIVTADTPIVETSGVYASTTVNQTAIATLPLNAEFGRSVNIRKGFPGVPGCSHPHKACWHLWFQACLTGRRIMKVVPLPSSLSTSMSPWCRCTIA